MRSTQSERLTDTMQLNHKRITRPEVSRADKIMHAISACVKSIKAESNSGSDEQMRQLKQLESLAGGAVAQDPAVRQAIQPTRTHAPPRVLTNEAPAGNAQRLTRSMTAGQTPFRGWKRHLRGCARQRRMWSKIQCNPQSSDQSNARSAEQRSSCQRAATHQQGTHELRPRRQRIIQSQ